MKPLTPEMQQNRKELLNRAHHLIEEGDLAATQALEKMELFLRDKSELVMQLYRATGTFDDFVAASGFGSLKEGLLALTASAQGRTYEREPQGKPPTIDEVNDKLKQHLVGDKKALSIHAELPLLCFSSRLWEARAPRWRRMRQKSR